jgi:hypothetical protein
MENDMTRISIKSATRFLMVALILVLAFGTLSFAQGYRYKSDNAWSFGVHGDTQWTLEGNLADNPNYVAVAMIKALNEQFKASGVKFVIQTGDLTDRGTAKGMYSRADAAQDLYSNGIGFFPIRGNHEASESVYYPDNNNPPVNFSLDMNLPAYRDAFPQVLGMYLPDGINQANFGAYNFSTPSSVMSDRDILDGLSYSFDYGKAGNKAKFVFVDTEATGYIRYIPTRHPAYGDPYLYILWTCYNQFLGKPVYNPDGTFFKGVYGADGTLIQHMYDVAGNELDSIYDVKRTLVSSRYVNNIIRVLFDRDGNIVNGYYDVSGNPINTVYRKDGSIFAPTYDGESGWISELIYDVNGNEIPALYDCARHVIPAVYDINHQPLTFYDSANPATRKPLEIKALDFWFRISGSNPNKLSVNFSGFDTTFPLTDWTILDVPSWKTAGTEFFPGKQQPWISEQLGKTTRGTEHAFVFSHRPLINGNHTDSFFGASSAETPADQNAFYASLTNNDVKFMISGHDHLYNRAIDKSPDGSSKVMQIITQGASTKFYTPTKLEDFGKDGTAPNQTWVKDRETQISQEVKNFGYYIYTVDGPRVTVDYYSDAVGNFVDGSGYPDGSGSLKVPDFDFVLQEEWGYSLNGNQVIVAQGGSFVGIGGSFEGTTATILAGTNNSASVDLTPFNSDGTGGPRKLAKAVNTGWIKETTGRLRSNIFSLWGMAEYGNEQTETYVLSMAFDLKNRQGFGQGEIGIASLDSKGRWVNAVELNFGGKKKFILGPYSPVYANQLGTYGIDPVAKTAWAVINYNADFAVAEGIQRPGK